jgi:hypothetical protein
MDSTYSRGASHIAVTAALSVAILIAATGMQLGKTFAQPPAQVPVERVPVAPREYAAIDDADGNGIPDWQDELARAGISFSTSSAATTTSSTTVSLDPLSGFGQALAQTLIGGYYSLAENESYTAERGENLAKTIVENYRAPQTFTAHTVDELSLDENTSKDRRCP